MAIAIKGARWSALAAGFKKPSPDGEPALDLALLELGSESTLASVFTQNAFCAAPVLVAKERCEKLGRDKNNIYCLINAGNANAGTGEQGMQAAYGSTQAIADVLGGSVDRVLPFSTGVIGEPLPVNAFKNSAELLVKGLDESGWEKASRAIMTTDTVPKLESATTEVGGELVNIAGIAKGAGMIKPNMATMLAYIVCDAKIDSSSLQLCLAEAVSKSFNRITVDGDTSTNDACVLAATGQGKVDLGADDGNWQVFVDAVSSVLQKLAMSIISDAEGASKFVQIDVLEGTNAAECLSVAYTVAESPLVKTALFASDANWGRILAAVGRAGLEKLDVHKVRIALNDYVICENGSRVADYNEDRASEIMRQDEINLTISLGRGDASERVWTSDLSHDYVRINAEYRT